MSTTAGGAGGAGAGGKAEEPPLRFMTYKYLGKSGLRVSRLSLGCMAFGMVIGGMDVGCSEDTAHKIMDRYAEVGGNLLDTANKYSGGLSETIIGNWLAKREDRDRFVIATKVRFGDPTDDINNEGLSRKHIMASVKGSLARLQTDYIDILQLHCWDDGTPLEETLDTLKCLIRAGTIRYIGVSNFLGWQLQKFVDESKRLGIPAPVSTQSQYSLLCRWTEWDVQQVCKNEGLCLMPWSPLKGGWLTGKFKRGDSEAIPGTRAAMADKTGIKFQSCPGFSMYADDEAVWSLLEAMKEIADAHGRTVAQVAIRWLLQRDAVDTVVIGVRTMAQLEDNLAAATFELTTEDMDRLTKLSDVPVPYPWEMAWRANFSRSRD